MEPLKKKQCTVKQRITLTLHCILAVSIHLQISPLHHKASVQDSQHLLDVRITISQRVSSKSSQYSQQRLEGSTSPGHPTCENCQVTFPNDPLIGSSVGLQVIYQFSGIKVSNRCLHRCLSVSDSLQYYHISNTVKLDRGTEPYNKQQLKLTTAHINVYIKPGINIKRNSLLLDIPSEYHPCCIVGCWRTCSAVHLH